VDFENVFYALVSEPVSLLRESALSATMDALGALRRQLRDQDLALVVERSYADWERLPSTAQRQLQIAGILPRFVDARVDKNSADIELSLDILYHLLTRQELGTIVLVGGDRDYLPILRRLKEQHRGICVCSLKASLAGDVRAFVGNYAEASIIELDGLVDLTQYPRTQPRVVVPVAPTPAFNQGPPAPTSSPQVVQPPTPQVVRPKPREYRPNDDNYEWHERYLQSMLRFIREHRYREIHLGPFIRWLQAERVFELVSGDQVRRVFDDLVALDAVRVEERDTGQGYPFTVVTLNYNHPLVHKVNEA
jgi:hypothetical protein